MLLYIAVPQRPLTQNVRMFAAVIFSKVEIYRLGIKTRKVLWYYFITIEKHECRNGPLNGKITVLQAILKVKD